MRGLNRIQTIKITKYFGAMIRVKKCRISLIICPVSDMANMTMKICKYKKHCKPFHGVREANDVRAVTIFNIHS